MEFVLAVWKASDSPTILRGSTGWAIELHGVIYGYGTLVMDR
jgi:hypothetical protein